MSSLKSHHHTHNIFDFFNTIPSSIKPPSKHNNKHNTKHNNNDPLNINSFPTLSNAKPSTHHTSSISSTFTPQYLNMLNKPVTDIKPLNNNCKHGWTCAKQSTYNSSTSTQCNKCNQLMFSSPDNNLQKDVINMLNNIHNNHQRNIKLFNLINGDNKYDEIYQHSKHIDNINDDIANEFYYYNKNTNDSDTETSDNEDNFDYYS